MYLDEYSQVCDQCDAILRSYGANDPEVVSISSLHVLNGHPSNIEKYQPAQYSRLVLVLGFICAATYRILRALFSPNRLLSPYFSVDPEVVIFSHLLKPEQLKDVSDFYFGNLPQALSASGKRILLVLLNHTGKQAAHIWSNSTPSLPSRLPVLSFLNPFDELCIALAQWRLFMRFSHSNMASKIKSVPNLAFDPLSSRTTSNLRFYKQMLALLRKLKPSSVVATYEGHAWERLAFYAARKARPSVKCIAYQHSVIFPMQHSIRRSLGPLFDPDKVLFAGRYGRDWFLEHSDFNPAVFVVGTPRYDPLVQSISSKHISHSGISSCLLIPDGTLCESLALLRFGLNCARCIPYVRFVMRLHPVLSFEELVFADPSLCDLPSNLILSDKSIQSDFLESRWALYRGSAAGVRAAMSGLRPIYCSIIKTGISIDPLHMLCSWRREAAAVADVASILNDDLSASPDSINYEYLSACNQLDSIFSPYDLASFMRHI